MQKPKWDKPAPPPPQALGMVQLLIKEAELEASEACFLLLHCGAQWGRSVTLPSSKTHNFNWEVRIREFGSAPVTSTRKNKQTSAPRTMLNTYGLATYVSAFCCHPCSDIVHTDVACPSHAMQCGSWGCVNGTTFMHSNPAAGTHVSPDIHHISAAEADQEERVSWLVACS